VRSDAASVAKTECLASRQADSLSRAFTGLRAAFSGGSIVSSLHRLNLRLRLDRVMLMSGGKVADADLIEEPACALVALPRALEPLDRRSLRLPDTARHRAKALWWRRAGGPARGILPRLRAPRPFAAQKRCDGVGPLLYSLRRSVTVGSSERPTSPAAVTPSGP